MSLLGNYIRSYFPDITLLRCNGLFSLCERDSESNWKRSLDQCLRCMHEQKKLSSWAALQLQDLSAFLHPDEIEQTKREIIRLPRSRVRGFTFKGLKLFEIYQNTLNHRLDGVEVDLSNKNHEQVVRRLLLSTYRMVLASDRFISTQRPEFLIVAGGTDFITQTLLKVAQMKGTAHSRFHWEVSQKCIRVSSSRSNEELSCQLLFDDVTTMRPDVATWPMELITILDSMLHFLGLSRDHLVLPLAK